MNDLPVVPAEERASPWLRPLLLALLLLGCALRIVPWTSNHGMGYDESFYRKYLLMLDQHGLAAYPDICAAYLQDGEDTAAIAKVPPLRTVFIVGGLAWKRLAFGAAPPADVNTPEGIANDPALIALHRIATLFGCLALWPAWALARRLFREREALAILALFACSPLLIHTSQHGFIDGVFGTCALFALWTLVESLREKAHRGWLLGFAISFALTVLAKETALFVGAAIAAILLFSRSLGWGPATRLHWGAAIAGGLFAITLLSFAAGGFRTVADVYLLFIHKVQLLPYAHETGRGPWYRYLVDLMVFTPTTLCFALGGAFLTLSGDRRAAVLLLFLAITYAAMGNTENGMNLRYATIWELPLRALAVVQVTALSARMKWPHWALPGLTVLLCAIDLRQYYEFFVAHTVSDLASQYLLKAVEILK